MKLLCRITFLSLLTGVAFPIFVPGQAASSAVQLKEKLKKFEQQRDHLKDTAYTNTLIDLADLYVSSYPDSALSLLEGQAEYCRSSGYREGEVDIYMLQGDAFQTKGNYEKALENYEKSFGLAKNINDRKGLPLILNRIGIIHLNQGNYPAALSKFYESLKAAEAINNNDLIGAIVNNIAAVHYHQGMFHEAESTYRRRLKIAEEMRDTSSMSLAYNGIGEVSLQKKDHIKALLNLSIAHKLALQVNDPGMLLLVTLTMAETYYGSGSLQKADSLFEKALLLSKQNDNSKFICDALIGLAKVRNRQGLLKEALANALEALQRAEKMGHVQLMRDANEIVSTIYEALGEGNSALRYHRMYKVYSDSMNNLASQRAVAIEKASYEFSKKELEFERKALQQRWLTFAAFAGLFSLAVVLWIIIRNRNRLHNTNKELQQKNAVIEMQKLKAEETLSKLQVTQAQLIQSEKMASLGELAAGIAHEIQNPLNFVNNFSEVNVELIDELETELNTGNTEQAISIAHDIKINEGKINHHGKRADGIVKGMLQHSRSTGQKEPTNINALVDEYLRLAYHGLRAKDKSFNATMKTDYDGTIGNINIIPQDVGRVLLNLITNAFYAALLLPEGGSKAPYEKHNPTIWVSTKKIGDKIDIRVRDNGNGIPQKVLDKIFQPFFTTKPTGQGTGLGLSLSYDIVKAHAGELKVETKEGEFAEFILTLPAWL